MNLNTDLLAAVARQIADLGDAADVPNTANAQAEYGRQMSILKNRRRAITNATAELDELTPKIVPIEVWIAHLEAWRSDFLAVMDTLPSRRVDRTTEQEQQMFALIVAVKQIDFGVEYLGGRASITEMLREKITSTYAPTWQMTDLDPWGVGFGSLAMSKQRLADLVSRRDAAQAQLDQATV